MEMRSLWLWPFVEFSVGSCWTVVYDENINWSLHDLTIFYTVEGFIDTQRFIYDRLETWNGTIQ